MRARLTEAWRLGFYWWAVYALRFVLWCLARWQVEGRERVPPSGALIIVSNHLNNTDPPILASAILRRRIRFMAKIELFRGPIGLVVRSYGAFPVRRFEADLGAMLTAERFLKRGEALGMFPEGTRSRTGRLGQPHPGTALIALRSGATVLPCAITGTERLASPLGVLKRPPIRVVIGEPIALEAIRRPTDEQVSALTKEVFSAIEALLPPVYRGAYTQDGEVPPGSSGENSSSQ